jgi:hypothetical protein
MLFPLRELLFLSPLLEVDPNTYIALCGSWGSFSGLGCKNYASKGLTEEDRSCGCLPQHLGRAGRRFVNQ